MNLNCFEKLSIYLQSLSFPQILLPPPPLLFSVHVHVHVLVVVVIVVVVVVLVVDGVHYGDGGADYDR